MDQKSRKERIEQLLLLIGGLEESIRESLAQRDYPFVEKLKPLKKEYYEKLRRVVYGLPEESQKPE